jgi:preprotein translocase subunit SecA
LQPSFDEAKYNAAKPKEIVGWIVEDLHNLFARRQKAVADTVRKTMEVIYKENELMMDRVMHFPITDGHLGFHVPVSLERCKASDGMDIYKVFAKIVLFTTIDDAWREHLREMDELRHSVQNATYEQKDPLLIYKLESYDLFSKMLEKVNRETLAVLNKAYIPVRENNPESVQQARQQKAKVDVNKLQASRMAAAAAAGQAEKSKPAPIKVEKKVGRNDPCPCGSGKKYKHCHGKAL